MYVTAPNLAHYLIARGQITPESVVEGDFMIAEAGRRNRNFKLIRRNAQGLFIKQIRTFDQQAITTLQREAACYSIAGSSTAFAPLARLMPRFLHYDPVRYTLIVELLPDAENLTEYHNRLGAFPEEVGTLLGRGLGAYHSDIGTMFSDRIDTSMFPRHAPFILSAHLNPDSVLNTFSGANVQLVGILRRYPEFTTLLDALRNDWRQDSLTHGDMKWDNCMVFKGEGDELDFRIVDWELADMGDAAWDVGSVLQTYLTFWILSMPVTHDLPPERFVDAAYYKLEAMQPAIGAFWRSYVSTRGIDEVSAGRFLERCISYGAARMVHTAFEHMYFSPQLTATSLAMLQVSLNMLKEPAGTSSDLLGL